MRIGHGFDVHRFGEGDHIVLGGVSIPCSRGLEAHSDGDVLIHALCDALLGACSLGDIGKHFPDSDAQYENIDSRILLREVIAAVAKKGFEVANADMTLVAQVPKLAPYTEQMCINMAEDLGVARDQLNVKATTTEKLGYAGREEGVAAYAVVLLSKLEAS